MDLKSFGSAVAQLAQEKGLPAEKIIESIETALAAALNSGKLGGAGFDVLSQEPPRNGNILFTAKNVILTPHSAWSTVEARQNLINETALNIKAFFEGKPRNVVS